MAGWDHEISRLLLEPERAGSCSAYCLFEGGGGMQLATHFTACISTSAFLCGTREVASGTTMSDCGPSSALKVHWNCSVCTPRCWHEFLSSAASSAPGWACN